MVRGAQGVDYLYDAAGQRVSATHQADLTQRLYKVTDRPYGFVTWWDEDPEFQGSPAQLANYNFTGDRQETYQYNLDGSLHAVSVAQTLVEGGGSFTPSVVGMGNAVLTASYTTDLAGRTTHQVDYAANGAAAYDSSITFNGKGQVWKEVTSTLQGGDTLTSSVENLYGTGTGYALGALVSSTTVETRLASGSSTPTPVASTTTTNTLAWWDGAVTASSSAVRTPAGGTAATPIVTTYGYGADGSLTSVGVGGTGAYTVTFTNDTSGQAIARDRGAVGTSGPHELWYRYGGKEVGYTGNNGTQDTDYLGSIAARTAAPPATPGPFRNGATAATAYADFDQSLAPINSFSQGGAAGSYEVHAGDTLAGIAAGLWGDSALWYKLAEANGLGANAGLVEGQRLSVPAGVMKNTHNASTFNPYDPSEVIGDVGPAPTPAAKKNKCGVFGAVMLAAVAVAVAVVTAGALAAAITPAIHTIGAGIAAMAAGGGAVAGGAGVLIGIGAAAGAAGSIASQGLGVATGLQDKFSWKGVALAGIGGGIGAGIGASGLLSKIGSSVVRGALAGAAGNLANQGVALMTGLQDKFDWAGLAGATLGGAASTWTGARLGSGFDRYGAQAIASAANAITNAAARSLVDGTDFGDNILAALPDVIGSTLGNILSGEIQRAEARRSNHQSDSAERRQEPQPGQTPEGQEIVVTRTAASYDVNVSPREEFDTREDAERELRLESEYGDRDLNTTLGSRLGTIAEEGGHVYINWETVAKPDGSLRYRYSIENGAGTPIGNAPPGDPFGTQVNAEKLNRRGIYNEVENGEVYVWLDRSGNPTTRSNFQQSPDNYTRTLQDYDTLREAYSHLAHDAEAKRNFDRFLSTDVPVIISGGEARYSQFNSFIIWNPHAALAVPGRGYQSPALGLYHEIGHAFRYQANVVSAISENKMGHDASDGTHRMPLSEFVVIDGFETPVARRLGEPVRLYHRGEDVVVSQPSDFSNSRRRR